jgi:hypothetical protein
MKYEKIMTGKVKAVLKNEFLIEWSNTAAY